MFSNDLAYFHDSTIPEALFGVPDPIFCVIREGLLSRKKIRITHLSANEEVEREIFPEVVFRCSDCWYLSAYCYLRQEARTFRLDRITKAELTGKKGKSHGIAEDFKKNGVPWLWEPEIKTPLPPSPEYEAKQKLRSISFNLVYCAERNDMEGVKKALADGADINYRHSGHTPLVAAAWGGYFEMTKFLLEQGADPLQLAASFMTAQIAAAHSGNTDLLRYLTEEQPNLPEARDCNGMTALSWAVYSEKSENVAYLLSRGVNIENMNQKNERPLHLVFHSAIHGNDCEKILRLLLDHHAEIDPVDRSGRTPLFHAIHSGSPEGIRLLLERGASLSVSDKYGNTPLNYFFKRYDTGVCEYSSPPDLRKMKETALPILQDLCRHGANVNTIDREGITPLMLARGEFFHFLLNYGASCHTCDCNGKTVAMYHADSVEELNILLNDHGVDFYEVDAKGKTVLEYAPPDLKVISFLLDHIFFDLNKTDEMGNTILHRAAESGNLELVRYLMEKGAEETENEEGLTPFDLYADSCMSFENLVVCSFEEYFRDPSKDHG